MRGPRPVKKKMGSEKNDIWAKFTKIKKEGGRRTTAKGPSQKKKDRTKTFMTEKRRQRDPREGIGGHSEPQKRREDAQGAYY